MNTSSQRNLTADVLKGLAVLFMIQVHIMEQFASAEVNTSIFGKISYFLGGPFCAPVFIAVMGYFIAVSNKSFSYFLNRGVLLFLAGILLNIGRSVHLFISIFQGKYNLDYLFYIFGADLLTMAGLSIILIGLLRLISKNSLFLYIPVLLLFSLSGNFININTETTNYFNAYFIGEYDHSYFPLFPWFSYVLAGYLFRIIYIKYEILLTRFKSIYWILFGLSGLIIIYFAPYAFNISNNLKNYYHHNFYFFLWEIGFMIIYIQIINQIVKLLKNSLTIDFLSWMGENVTVIYIIQWLIIGNIATAIYQTQDLLESELWLIGICSFSCIFAYLYLKIRTIYKNREDHIF